MVRPGRQLHLHVHIDGNGTLQSKRSTHRRICAMILDTGFYMLMAAALMSSLCIFLTMYSTDIDPNSGGHAYRATFVRNGAKLKRLFTLHSSMNDHDAKVAQEMAALGRAEREAAAHTSFQNGTEARSAVQFRKFVLNLKDVSVPTILTRDQLKLKGHANTIPCGKSEVVKLPSYRAIRSTPNENIVNLLPEQDPLQQESYETCAVVGNSGSLLEDERGPEIDEHDAVFRFNAARITGFEQFVGSKTTFRILNSPDAVWPKDGNEATLMTLRSHEQLSNWMKAIDKNKLGKGKPYIADPSFLCHTWDWVQQTGDKPSSGLVGVVMALRACKQVNLYGFQSSNYFGRFTRPHYYDWERPKKGRENVHPFAREVWLYQQLDKYKYIKIN